MSASFVRIRIGAQVTIVEEHFRKTTCYQTTTHIAQEYDRKYWTVEATDKPRIVRIFNGGLSIFANEYDLDYSYRP